MQDLPDFDSYVLWLTQYLCGTSKILNFWKVILCVTHLVLHTMKETPQNPQIQIDLLPILQVSDPGHCHTMMTKQLGAVLVAQGEPTRGWQCHALSPHSKKTIGSNISRGLSVWSMCVLTVPCVDFLQILQPSSTHSHSWLTNDVFCRLWLLNTVFIS